MNPLVLFMIMIMFGFLLTFFTIVITRKIPLYVKNRQTFLQLKTNEKLKSRG
jgi:hypothetical protein